MSQGISKKISAGFSLRMPGRSYQGFLKRLLPKFDQLFLPGFVILGISPGIIPGILRNSFRKSFRIFHQKFIRNFVTNFSRFFFLLGYGFLLLGFLQQFLPRFVFIDSSLEFFRDFSQVSFQIFSSDILPSLQELFLGFLPEFHL